ncbi:hypothetical protein BC941DRAFT_82404 [Chlamydoabsidia padenii]|nr:hypothetical protein BC941DRAFT_82404 [Chlamydoabsidia padenii]
MWEMAPSINQEADDIITNTRFFSSSKLSLDSATIPLHLEDQSSTNSVRDIKVPSCQYNSYLPLVMGSKRKDDDYTTSYKSKTDTSPPPSKTTRTTSTFISPCTQFDTHCGNDTNKGDDDIGDISSAMGELATLMLGCSILDNNTDKVTKKWCPTQTPTDNSSSDLKRVSTTTTTMEPLSISDSVIPSSFDLDFTHSNTSSPHDQGPPSKGDKAAHSGDGEHRCITSHRKILPLPKRRSKATPTQQSSSLITATAAQQSIPTSTQFTFRSPLSSSIHPDAKGTRDDNTLFTTFNYDSMKQQTKDHEMPCDYTKKPKRDETCTSDQGNNSTNSLSLTNNQKRDGPTAISSALNIKSRRPSLTATPFLWSNSQHGLAVSSSQQHTSNTSPRAKPIQQRPSWEKKKKTKKKKQGLDSNKQQQQFGIRHSTMARRHVFDSRQEGYKHSNLDLVNTTFGSNDWICLFCQYEIFKVGWIEAKRMRKQTRRAMRGQQDVRFTPE